MCDLFAGRSTSLSPWIQSTVCQHLQTLLRQRQQRQLSPNQQQSLLLGIDGVVEIVENAPQRQPQQRPKVVQLIQVPRVVETNGDHYPEGGGGGVLLSDGQHSIPVVGLLDQYYYSSPPPPPLTRGAVVRISHWEIMVVQCRSSTARTGNDDGWSVFLRVLPKPTNPTSSRTTSTRSSCSTSIRYLGKQDVWGDRHRITPILQDTDVRRVLEALLLREPQQRSTGSRNNNNGATTTRTAALLLPTGGLVGSETHHDDDDDDDEIENEDDLPLGNVAHFLALSTTAAAGRVVCPEANAPTHSEDDDDDDDDPSSSTAAEDLPLGNVAQLFSAGMDSTIRAAVVTAGRSNHHHNNSSSSLDHPVEMDYPVDDEDDDDMNYGISRMLVDPTTPENTRNDDGGEAVSDHEEQPQLVFTTTTPTPTKTPSPTTGSPATVAAILQAQDDEMPENDWNGGGGDVDMNDDDESNSNNEIQGKDAVGGVAMDEEDNTPMETQAPPTERPSAGFTSTRMPPPSDTTRDVSSSTPTTTPTTSSSSSAGRLVSHWDHWERLVRAAAATELSNAPHETTIPMYRWAGDRIRVLLE